MMPATSRLPGFTGLWVVLTLVLALWAHQQLGLWYDARLVGVLPIQNGQENGEISLPPPDEPLPPDEPPPTPPVPSLPTGPKLAIIIDDLGWDAYGTDAILALPYPLTMAVLPDGSTTRSDVEASLAAGHEVFLHLPMEPLGGFTGRPPVVAVAMSDEEIDVLVTRYLVQIPEAVGVNNHMGSKATSDQRVAERVLRLIADRGLVFVDSRTWRHSVMCEVAGEVGVPCVYNQVFLDNEKTLTAVTAKLQEAAQLAHAEGQAVVIGHAHPITALALEQELPHLIDSGIHLVYASQLALVQPPKGD